MCHPLCRSASDETFSGVRPSNAKTSTQSQSQACLCYRWFTPQQSLASQISLSKAIAPRQSQTSPSLSPFFVLHPKSHHHTRPCRRFRCPYRGTATNYYERMASHLSPVYSSSATSNAASPYNGSSHHYHSHSHDQSDASSSPAPSLQSTRATTMSSSSSVCSSLSPAAAELSASFNSQDGHSHSYLLASNMSADLSNDSSADGCDADGATPCKWDNCGQLYDDPEALYQHLCNDHVGRKSTNNLCLTCRWQDCDVTCAKRDHITSHLRVHTPLKPHSCVTCGKTFKRPQDLKKHERIHTEDHQQKQAQTKLQKQQQAAHAKELLKRQQDSVMPMQGSGAVGAHLAHPYHHSAQHLYATPHGYPLYPAAHQPARDASASHISSHLSSTQSTAGLHTHGYPTDGQHLGNALPHNSYLALANQQAAPSAAARSHVTGAPDTAVKHDPADPNSYAFLSQGAHTGTKRGYDDLLNGVGALFEDAKKKRVANHDQHYQTQSHPSTISAPHSLSYDANMAQKLNSVFGSSFDEFSLQAILGNEAMPQATAEHRPPNDISQWPSQQQQDQPQQLPHQQHMTTSLASDTNSKIAELNAFLLQLGNSAARDVAGAAAHYQPQQLHNSPASTTTTAPASVAPALPSTSAPPGFDLASLSAAGLTNIPGFDESIFNFDFGSANGSHVANRPIASMPRSHVDAGHGVYAPSSQPWYPDTGAYSANTPSFDSVRPSRGSHPVPSLPPRMDASSFRHVEPLMRAAPSGDVVTSAEEVPAVQQKSLPSAMYPSLPPLSSPSSSPRRGTPPSLPSISSLLNASASPLQDGSSRRASVVHSRSSSQSTAWRERSARQSSMDTTMTDPSSPIPQDDDDDDNVSARPLYPSLPSSSPSPASSASSASGSSASAIGDRIRSLALAAGEREHLAPVESSGAEPQSGDVPMETRLRHIALIKTLLIAINFPERLHGTLSQGEADDDVKMDVEEQNRKENGAGVRTPRALSPSSSNEEGSQQSSNSSNQTAQGSSPPSSKEGRRRDWLNTIVGGSGDAAGASMPMASEEAKPFANRKESIEV